MAFERVRNLRPVKRYRSERYVLISLVAFAFTVVVVRGALKLTGYPQLGGDTIHIAHVLWGGLALFGSSLLLLIISNRWALGLGAILCGGGVGLFIDQVGKFITQSNNYFTPAAAPIIYGLFLATVLVYLQVRRPRSGDTRGEMYKGLEQMSGVLDHEMSRHDLGVLQRRLERLQATAEEEAVRGLAGAMLAFVMTQRPKIVEPQPGRVQRLLVRVRCWASRVFTRPRLHIFLVLASVALGIYAVLDMALLAFLAVAPASGATEFLRSLISLGELQSLQDKIWFSIRAVLEGGVGVTLLAGGALMGLRREWRALGIVVVGLVVELTVVDLLVFYQDTIKALVGIAVQCVLLVAALAYRRIYLEDEAEEAGQACAGAEEEFAEALLGAATDPLAAGRVPS
ncbi:MAG: hypothetical protein A2133_01775 [Actinobacteria bacterium RBG_16_64_13]|nr:MAG: hypothetical protein A2133_01775 [Actinobacteria bacterium RBG_16_64_13]